MREYDTVVVGAGPGGYEAALELAKEGVKPLLIERSKERLGGTCLNEGCTPAKNYIESADYAMRLPHFRANGLGLGFTGLDLGELRTKTFALKGPKAASTPRWRAGSRGRRSATGEDGSTRGGT